MAWTVYIVEGRTGRYYTGITTDVVRRIDEHNHSKLGAKWCKAQRPVRLRWTREADSRSAATRIELRIKRLSHREKLELIAGNVPKGLRRQFEDPE